MASTERAKRSGSIGSRSSRAVPDSSREISSRSSDELLEALDLLLQHVEGGGRLLGGVPAGAARC